MIDLRPLLGKLFAQDADFAFDAQNAFRQRLDFGAQFFHLRGAGLDVGLQDVKLVAGQLGVQMLEFGHQLLVTAGFASLALERTDLALDFADQVGDAQEVLFGGFEFAQRLLFLRLEFRDARRFLKHQPPVFRLAGQDLRDVSLRQDAVTGPPHARSHEQLLNVFEPAGGLVEKVFARPVPKHPSCQHHFIVGYLHSRGRQMLAIHPAYGQRHLRHAQGFAGVCAVENDIRHLPATQRLG